MAACGQKLHHYRDVTDKGSKMEIIMSEKDGIVCVAMRDRLGGIQSSEFAGAIKAIIQSDRCHLIFDLSGVSYLKTPVLRVILNAIKEIHQKSGKVVLCCMNGYVKEIFEVTHFSSTISITDSLESGLKEFDCKLAAA